MQMMFIARLILKKKKKKKKKPLWDLFDIRNYGGVQRMTISCVHDTLSAIPPLLLCILVNSDTA
jgi:hypothetical protein